jgi:hypothetical protein
MLLGAEVDRIDARLRAAALLPHQLQTMLQLVAQLAVHLGINHQNPGAGQALAAPQLQLGTIHHEGILGGSQRERRRAAHLQARFHQQRPAANRGHQQTGEHHHDQGIGAPTNQGLTGPLPSQQAPPDQAQPAQRPQ